MSQLESKEIMGSSQTTMTDIISNNGTITRDANDTVRYFRGTTCQEIREMAKKIGFNSVHEVLVDGNLVAVLKKLDTKKCIINESEIATLRYKPCQQAYRELIALQSINRCEHSTRRLFPKVIDYAITEDLLYIMEEKASEGSLEEFLSNRFNNGPAEEFVCLEKSSLPAKMQLSFGIRMLIAVHAMKTVYNICHNDLRGNILVTKCDHEYETYFLKPGVSITLPTFGFSPMIADFGQACPFRSNPEEVYELCHLGIPLFCDDFEDMMNIIRGGKQPMVLQHRTGADIVETEIWMRTKWLLTRLGWRYWFWG